MKKSVFSLILVLCLVFGMAVPAFAANSTYKVETIVSPQYEDAQAFSEEGLAAVKQGGKWGYINESGAMVISPQFDWAGEFSEGVAVVSKIESVNTWGSEYEDAHVFYLINKSGSLTPLMRAGEDNDTGQAKNVPNCYYLATLDYNGETIESVSATWFCNDGGIIVNGVPYTAGGVRIEPKGTGVLDYKNELTYIATGVTSDGIFPMRAIPMYTDGFCQCFLMDAGGNITKVFPSTNYEVGDRAVTYINGVDHKAGRVIVEYGGYNEDWEYVYSYGAVDLSGNWKVQPGYENFRYMISGTFFSDGLWTVQSNGKYGAVDVNGKVVIPLKYDFMGSFQEGMAQVLENGKMYYIDLQGNSYQVEGLNGGRGAITAATHFEDGVAAVYDSVSGKAYCIQNTPVNGVLPLILGTDSLGMSVYFPDYVVGEDLNGLIRGVDEILAIQENGKWGYSRLTFNLVAHNNPFTDVIPGDFYYYPVLWAVEKAVTSGTSATTFSPKNDCTRGQVVTFLWRAMGEPEPKTTENPFTDISESDYFYKAVLWAFENGVTSGTSDTTFSPGANCTRGQVVTFLWRTEGEPGSGAGNPFTDVQGSAYYAGAVGWAVENGITTGTSNTTFSPNDDCTRGQVVTFLYRDLEE